MRKTEEFDRRVSLRLTEEFANEIDEFIKKSGMSFTEFLRRACREKLDREKDSSAPQVSREELKELIREVLEERKEDRG